MGLVIFLLVLALLFGGLGFVVHWLWIAFLVCLAIAAFRWATSR